MKKIRILHTIRQGQIGGGETHVLNLVDALDKSRFESVVLSFTDGEMVNRLQALNIPCHVIHTLKPFDVFKWNNIKEWVRSQNVDIVHAHGTRACSNSFYSARKLKLPMVYTIHGWSFHHTQPYPVFKVRKLSERFLVNRSLLNIAVSDSNQREGINYLGMPNSVVIKNGVDLNRFNPDATYTNVRKELGISVDTTLVGYIVRITEQKDPLTLIRAIRYVADKNMNIRFLIIGNGDLKKQMLDLATELDVTPYITFQDFRTDIPDVLNAIDIYCLPSLWEGLPIGLLEAMAMRKAIVATPADGVKELIVNNENGILVPMRDPEKLGDAMIRLHNDKELRTALANHARREIELNYNLDLMVKNIENVYTSIHINRKS